MIDILKKRVEELYSLWEEIGNLSDALDKVSDTHVTGLDNSTQREHGGETFQSST